MKRFIMFGILVGLSFIFAFRTIAEDSSKVQIEHDVVYGHKYGLALTMDIASPVDNANGAAVIVLVSSGYYSWWQPIYEKPWNYDVYVKEGYTVFTVRLGSSPKFSIAEMIEDAKRAVRFIKLGASKYGVDSDKLGVTGFSASGHLALMLGLTGDDGNPDADDELEKVSSRVGAVAALKPGTDLTQGAWSYSPEAKSKYGEFPALDISIEEAKEVSPINFVSVDDAPCLFYMGEKDILVPAEQGQWLSEKMTEKNLTHSLHIFPNVGHKLEEANIIKFQSDAVNWFNLHLLNKPVKN